MPNKNFNQHKLLFTLVFIFLTSINITYADETLKSDTGITFSSVQEIINANQDVTYVLDVLESRSVNLALWSPLNRADYYILLAIWQEKASQLNSAINSYTKAIKEIESIPVSEQLVTAYLERAYIRYLQTYNPSIYCEDRKIALSYARQLKDPETLVKALTAFAFCFNSSSQFAEGLALLSEALDIAKKESLPLRRQAMIYNATASIYRNNYIYVQAIEYLEKAYDLWASVDDKQDMFNMLHTLVANQINIGNWKKAQSHVDKLYLLAESSPEFKDFYFFAHFNAGLVAYKSGQLESANSFLKNAISIKHTASETYFIRSAYAYLASVSITQGNNAQAVDAAQSFLALSPNTEDEKVMILLANAIIDLSAGKQSQAINKLLNIIDLKDQEKTEFVINAVASSSTIHDNKIAQFENTILEQQLAIQKLNVSQEIDKQRIAKQTITIIALVAFALLVIVIFLIISRNLFKIRAQTDHLTKIANRRYIFEKGQRLFTSAKRKNNDLSVILFDIDHFKRINDNFGHDIGDIAIIATAKQANHWIRKKDILGRIGGEEFLILLPETNHKKALEIAERVRIGIADKSFEFSGNNISFSISLGVASLTEENQDLNQLVKNADEALYKAKNGGRNRTESFTIK